MKSIIVTAPGRFEIIDIPKTSPGPDEVLIKIEAVATCPQWDIHLKNNDPMFVSHKFKYPYTPGQPGHEATGYVEETGEGVTKVRPGDRVAVWKDPGHEYPGCYAQYAIRNVNHILKISNDVPIGNIVSLELAMCVGTVFLMLKDMNVLNRGLFAVSGLGPAGLVAGMMAKAEGIQEIVGFDTDSERRIYALKNVFDKVYDPSAHPFEKRPGKTDIDTACDCVGLKKSVEFLMDITSDTVALFGVQREDYIFSPCHYNGLRLCGYKGHSIQSAEYALKLIEEKRIDLSLLISEYLPFEKYMDAVVESDRVEKDTAKTFAKNRLVVVFPKANPAGITGLKDLNKAGLKVVLAAKEVPAGNYALQILDNTSKDASFGATFKDDVLKNVVSYEDNVRAVLTKVSLGEADAGIVYVSDVTSDVMDKVEKADIPDELNVIATYPIAVIKDSKNMQVAQTFMDFVLSEAGQNIMSKWFFLPAK